MGEKKLCGKYEVSSSARFAFAAAYYKWQIYRLAHVKPKAVYSDRLFYNNDTANAFIGQKIEENSAFVAARFGANELGVVVSYLKSIGKHGNYSKNQVKALCNNAGFFPSRTDQIDRFAELMLSAAQEIDLLGVWNLMMEDYIVEHFMSRNIALCPLGALEPWSSEKEYWSRHLKGKRVLVIHPFADTIVSQYQNRTKIFPTSDMLPEFELFTVKAVQTAAGQVDSRFKDWFDALEYMLEKVMSTSFDIAILGCGAYGFPLAAEIKKCGKIAIHLGGATQLLFGIKGKRWESMPQINRLFNDAWVRPQAADRPEAAGSIENGCYW